MTDKERTRTISWEDPRPLAEAGRGMSGAEFLQKIVAGELPGPPLAMLMNFKMVEVGMARDVRSRSGAVSGKLYAHATTTCLILKV